MSLDPLDMQILDLLRQDASQSFKVIADHVGKTEATIRRRVKRMRDEAYIKKYTILLNDKKFSDKKVKATLKIVPDLKSQKSIANKLASLDIVDEAYLLSGECGIMLKVAANSIETITDFIENDLGAIQGIKSLDTCFIMKVLKEEQ